MRKAVGLGLSAASVVATGLIPTAAWAAVTSPAALSAPGPAIRTPPLPFTSDALVMAAPATADLGSGTPGGTISL